MKTVKNRVIVFLIIYEFWWDKDTEIYF